MTAHIEVFGLGGEPLTAPRSTEVSFRAALAGGADGVATGVYATSDGVLVCADDAMLKVTCGVDTAIACKTWAEVEALDAGMVFRSTVLGPDDQPMGAEGDDHPWQAKKSGERVGLITLERLLLFLARRARMLVFVTPEVVDATLSTLVRLGVADRVWVAGAAEVCQSVGGLSPKTPRVLVAQAAQSPIEALHEAEALEVGRLLLDWDQACIGATLDPSLQRALDASRVQIVLGSRTIPFSPKPEYFKAIDGAKGIAAVVTRGVERTVARLTPPAAVLADSFEGATIDRSKWTAGYSHANRDTTIRQDDGLHIHIAAGGDYSGAAAVLRLPLHGRFDARVKFRVDNPRQATTFELAAIGLDPGYFHIDNADLDSRRVNLTFDVHGAPPYASSERDEDDGFRCGWNNSFNLTRIDHDWHAYSGNMYNQYGRDVGDGSVGSPEGELRLVRNGPMFATHYRDRHNAGWVCSGAMLVQNLPSDVFLRLAAKHWAKGGTPPPNDVHFYDFVVYQF